MTEAVNGRVRTRVGRSPPEQVHPLLRRRNSVGPIVMSALTDPTHKTRSEFVVAGTVAPDVGDPASASSTFVRSYSDCCVRSLSISTIHEVKWPLLLGVQNNP